MTKKRDKLVNNVEKHKLTEAETKELIVGLVQILYCHDQAKRGANINLKWLEKETYKILSAWHDDYGE